MRALPMMILAALVSLIVVLSATAPAFAGQWQYERVTDNRVPTGTSGTLVMHGDNGDVLLIAADTNAIAVHSRIRAHDQTTLSNAVVNVQRTGNRFEIDARCPQAKRWFGYTNACNIDEMVTYPRGMNVAIEWVNGDVQIDNPSTDVSVHLTNGDVNVREAARSVELSARHGNVQASLASDWHGNSISLAVSEGDVVVKVPRAFDGYLDASVRIGDIANDAHLPTGARDAKSALVHASALIGDVTIRN